MIFAQGDSPHLLFTLLGFVFSLGFMALGAAVIALALQGACLLWNHVERASSRKSAELILPIGRAWLVVGLTLLGVSLLGLGLNLPLREDFFSAGDEHLQDVFVECVLGFPLLFPLVTWTFPMPPWRAAVATVIPSALPSCLAFPRTLDALYYFFMPWRATDQLVSGSVFAMAIAFATVALAIWLACGGWPQGRGFRPSTRHGRTAGHVGGEMGHACRIAARRLRPVLASQRRARVPHSGRVSSDGATVCRIGARRPRRDAGVVPAQSIN